METILLVEDDTDIHNLIKKILEKEKYKEAAAIYIEALKYNPISFELNYELGIVYTMLNDFPNAKI